MFSFSGFFSKRLVTSFSLLSFFGPSFPHDKVDSSYSPAVSAFQGCWKDGQHLPVPPSPAGYHKTDARVLEKVWNWRNWSWQWEGQAVEGGCVWDIRQAGCNLFSCKAWVCQTKGSVPLCPHQLLLFPLLVSSSLPLKKSNMNGFCKAEGLVWVFGFFPKLP